MHPALELILLAGAPPVVLIIVRKRDDFGASTDHAVLTTISARGEHRAGRVAQTLLSAALTCCRAPAADLSVLNAHLDCAEKEDFLISGSVHLHQTRRSQGEQII